MKKTNHILHLILTVLTGGLWLFVWIPLVIVRRGKSFEPVVVRVAYRELGEPAPSHDPSDLNYGYSYRWTLPQPPQIGHRVIVDGGSPAVVIGFGSDYQGELAGIQRFASAEEITASVERVNADRDAWLNMARKAAGLPIAGRVRTRTPEGFPEIAPVDGTATRSEADAYGRMWWRAFKTAEDAGWDASEVQALKSIAYRWYAVRDKGGNVPASP